MSWSVGFPTIPQESQLNAPPPSDGLPDENAQLNCGATSVSIVLNKYGFGIIPPDDLKDDSLMLGQGKTGITTQVMLKNELASWGLPSTVYYPTVERNTRDGFLDREYQYLKANKLLIGVFDWIDSNGVVYPNISHWRVIYYMTDTQITTADPWIGKPRVESWDQHWSLSKAIPSPAGGTTRLLLGIDLAVS